MLMYGPAFIGVPGRVSDEAGGQQIELDQKSLSKAEGRRVVAQAYSPQLDVIAESIPCGCIKGTLCMHIYTVTF